MHSVPPSPERKYPGLKPSPAASPTALDGVYLLVDTFQTTVLVHPKVPLMKTSVKEFQTWGAL